MPVGIEVGLGPGDIVLDGDPAPPRQGAQQSPPLFGPLCSGTVAHLSNYWAVVCLWFYVIWCHISWAMCCDFFSHKLWWWIYML